jgi:uncharacterized protein
VILKSMTNELTTFPVVFVSDGVTVAGRVYRHGSDVTERQPGVLVSGSWLTVKEQMADRYARELAARGYTAITFDFTGFGESGGEPRQLEVPVRKVADMTAAARWASRLSFLRPGGLGYLAICSSAAYTLAAIAQGAPITAYASVAGWYHDLTSVAPFYGGDAGVRRRLEWGQEATERYLRTGELVTVPAYEPGNERAGMSLVLDYYGDPRRGAIAQWRNEMALMTWSTWLPFDGLASAPGVSAPTLFVHSDGCVFPENIGVLRKRLAGPVEVAWGEGGQIDFYDQPAQVAFAMAAIDAHFGKYLR